jgi:hypothetical protein
MLALATVALVTAMPPGAMAEESPAGDASGDEPRLIRIGPQATLIESADGTLRMYDDPDEQVKVCESTAACVLTAIQAIGGIAILSPNAVFEGAGVVRRRALSE